MLQWVVFDHIGSRLKLMPREISASHRGDSLVEETILDRKNENELEAVCGRNRCSLMF